MGPGLCVFLRVQCEMRELVPDHVLISSGFEQVSSATVDIHPYSTSSSASSSSSSLPLGLPHPMQSTLASQQMHNNHSMRVEDHHGIHNNHSIPLKSLYHQDPVMIGSSSGGDGNAGLILSGSIGVGNHRTHYDGLGGEMTSGVIHGSGSNGTSVSSGDMYNGNYPQYMHPDISQGMPGTASVLHGQHVNWAPIFGGRQGPGLYMEQDQSGMSYISGPNPGSYPVVFPALTSLSSSLPDGMSKVQLPLPIRTQASEMNGSAHSRPSTIAIGNALANDTISYGNQSTSYRYAPWGGDSSYSSTSQSASSMAVSQTVSPGIPALPALSMVNVYGSHNGPVFPLSSSNNSLLPTTSRDTSSIPNSSTDSFCTQPSSHGQQQKDRSNSESSSGSRSVAPGQAMRTNSTSGSYAPTYSRSSGR